MVEPGFLLKRWDVHVRWASGARTTSTVMAPTRGAALADAWRSDAFEGATFGEFLRFANATRAHDFPNWGAQITVNGHPAFYCGCNGQYVQFVNPGETTVLYTHPSEVLPQQFRPMRYRTDTVNAISDERLLERAVKNARNPRKRGKHQRWTAVMAVFGLGSTFAAELCRRYNLDPEEMVRA
jgi:hypothetical protein